MGVRGGLKEILEALDLSWDELMRLGPMLKFLKRGRCRLFVVCPEDPGGGLGPKLGPQIGPRRLPKGSKFALGFDTVLKATLDP